MHLCIFNHRWSRCLEILNLLILHLPARPFSGLFGKAASPPVNIFTPPLVWLSSALCCLVLQGVSQHFGYLLSLASQPCPIWKITWRICSDIEGPFLFWCLRRFQRRLQSGQRIFQSLPCKLFDWSHLTYLGVSAIFSGYDILGDLRSALIVRASTVRPLVWQRFFWALDFQNYRMFRGFKIIGRTASQLRAMSREVWFLPFVVLVLGQIKFFQAASLLSDRILSAAVFPQVLWGGEEK